MSLIAVVDYGMGNLRSVSKAIEHVADDAEVRTTDIYRGVMPFIAIQLLALGLLALWPGFATWLPNQLYGN